MIESRTVRYAVLVAAGETVLELGPPIAVGLVGAGWLSLDGWSIIYGMTWIVGTVLWAGWMAARHQKRSRK
jgi:hypothetical protein